MAVDAKHHWEHIFPSEPLIEIPDSVRDLPNRNVTLLFNKFYPPPPVPEEAIRRLARIRTDVKIARGEGFSCEEEWKIAIRLLEGIRFRRFLSSLPTGFCK